MNPQITCVVDGACILGEGPVWDDRGGFLYWVDIKAPALHRYRAAGGETRRWDLPEPVGAAVPRAGPTGSGRSQRRVSPPAAR